MTEVLRSIPIKSMIDLRLLTARQIRENGNGPKILPCDKCRPTGRTKENPCKDPEGPLYEASGLVCPLQKGPLIVVYHAGITHGES